MTLVSIAEQEGSSLNWSPTPEDRFSQDVAHIYIHVDYYNGSGICQ